MMKGLIWGESTPEEGSSFQFTAQLGIQKEPATKVELCGQINIDGLPVLVVDDNLTNRLILQEILNCWRMKPTVVDSGTAALVAMDEALQRGNPFALGLLDCQMPSMDGFGAAPRIRV